MLFVLTSCATTYQYVQVLSVEPQKKSAPLYSKENGSFRFENEECLIVYDFWADKGNAGFIFYNKTDSIIYINLAQSFFIRNGVANDYYEDLTTSNTENKTFAYSTQTTNSNTSGYTTYKSKGEAYIAPATLTLNSNTNVVKESRTYSFLIDAKAVYSRNTGTAVRELPVMAIPPKSYKTINKYCIAETPIVSCDLVLYPANKFSFPYSEQDSPITFCNYITYGFDETHTDKHLEHKFYVSSITNCPKPQFFSYVKREPICKNLLTPEEIRQQKYAPVVYDAVTKLDTKNVFYVTYQVNSTQRLYRQDDDYRWSEQYKGYLMNTSTNQSMRNPHQVKNRAPKEVWWEE